MATCPSDELDDAFVQEMFVNELSEEQLASLRVHWEPFRDVIARRIEAFFNCFDESSWRDFRNDAFGFLPYPVWDDGEMLWAVGPFTQEQAWTWKEPTLEVMHAINARLVAACAHVWTQDHKRLRWERCDQCDAVQIPGRPSTRKIWVLRHPPVARSTS